LFFFYPYIHDFTSTGRILVNLDQANFSLYLLSLVSG
jgi:hypothetical protein